MAADRDWYQRELARLQQAGDRLGLLALSLRIIAENPSPGLASQAPYIFRRAAEGLLDAPRVLIRNAALAEGLVEQLERARTCEPLPAASLDEHRRRARLLAGFAALAGKDTALAHRHFEAAAASEALLPNAAAREKAVERLGHFQRWLARGFPVHESICRFYAELYPSEPFLKASRRTLEALRAETRPLELAQPGQIGILVARPDPLLGFGMGRVVRLSAQVEPGGGAGIRFSPDLAERVEQLGPEAGRQLAAVAEQALEVAARQLGTSSLRAQWDADLADDLLAGPSLGLGLVLALVSAHRGERLPVGLVATGKVNALGQVRPVGHLDSKARAALWQGGRILLVPAENWEQEDVPVETRRQLEEAGVAVQPVRTVAEGLAVALPRPQPEVEEVLGPPERPRRAVVDRPPAGEPEIAPPPARRSRTPYWVTAAVGIGLLGWLALARPFAGADLPEAGSAAANEAAITRPAPAGEGLIAEAEAARDAGDFERAEELARQALTAAGDDLAALKLLAEFALRRWDGEAGAGYLQRAIRIDPTDAEAWLGYAASLEMQEQLEEARRAYQQASALAGDDRELRDEAQKGIRRTR